MAQNPRTSDPLIQKVIGEAVYIHRVLGAGFLESIFHNALALRLRKVGLLVECQKAPLDHFEDEIIGNFQADLVIENKLIVELKAVSALNSAHEVQLVNDLVASRLDVGLPINFGAESMEFKRKYRTKASNPSLEAISILSSQSC